MDTPGAVYTFYSFKGGVGRSMAAANVAALLSNWGHRVLLVDFDLEAPGIEQYFAKYGFQGSPTTTDGVVDLILAFREGRPFDWSAALCRAYPFGSSKEPVSILTAGRRDRGYLERLQSIDWRDLFLNRGFGEHIEELRAQWLEKFDFVLLDSRTGYTDAGGLCTIQLPDILVLVLTTNNQNLDGTLRVIEEVRAARQDLPSDRGNGYILPVPSRVESWTEYGSAREWHNKFQAALGPFIDEWLPRRDLTGNEVLSRDVLDQVTLPHVAYWSFGEGLPVVEEGTEGKFSLGRAYSSLARLVEHRLDYLSAIGTEPTVPAERGIKTVVEQAEAAYQSLNPEEQKLASAVFARMVQFSGDPDLPPSVEAIDLKEFPDKRDVVMKLVQAKVVQLKEDRAYISDEVLLRSWQRLRDTSNSEALKGVRNFQWLVDFWKKNRSARYAFALLGSAFARLQSTNPELLSATEREIAAAFDRVKQIGTYALALYAILIAVSLAWDMGWVTHLRTVQPIHWLWPDPVKLLTDQGWIASSTGDRRLTLRIAKSPASWARTADGIRDSPSATITISGISDLSGIADLGSTAAELSLDLSGTKVVELSDLRYLTRLTWLRLAGTPVAKISDLAALTNLTYLDLSDTQVTDLSALSKLTNLKFLNLGRTRVVDLSPVKSLPNLEVFRQASAESPWTVVITEDGKNEHPKQLAGILEGLGYGPVNLYSSDGKYRISIGTYSTQEQAEQTVRSMAKHAEVPKAGPVNLRSWCPSSRVHTDRGLQVSTCGAK